LPKSLACRQSGYFRECYTAHGDETEGTFLDVPEENPKIFAMLVPWIYQEKLPLAETGKFEEAFGAFLSLLGLYQLALQVKIPKLQNETVHHLRAVYITRRSKHPHRCFLPFSVSTGIRRTCHLFVNSFVMRLRRNS